MRCSNCGKFSIPRKRSRSYRPADRSTRRRLTGAACVSNLDNPLDLDLTAIHLVFQVDHGRPIEMPGQAGAQRTTPAKLALEERKDIADGIELHRGGLAPVT